MSTAPQDKVLVCPHHARHAGCQKKKRRRIGRRSSRPRWNRARQGTTSSRGAARSPWIPDGAIRAPMVRQGPDYGVSDLQPGRGPMRLRQARLLFRPYVMADGRSRGRELYAGPTCFFFFFLFGRTAGRSRFRHWTPRRNNGPPLLTRGPTLTLPRCAAPKSMKQPSAGPAWVDSLKPAASRSRYCGAHGRLQPPSKSTLLRCRSVRRSLTGARPGHG